MNFDTTTWVSPKMKHITWKLINKRQHNLVGNNIEGFCFVLGRRLVSAGVRR